MSIEFAYFSTVKYLPMVPHHEKHIYVKDMYLCCYYDEAHVPKCVFV